MPVCYQVSLPGFPKLAQSFLQTNYSFKNWLTNILKRKQINNNKKILKTNQNKTVVTKFAGIGLQSDETIMLKKSPVFQNGILSEPGFLETHFGDV